MRMLRLFWVVWVLVCVCVSANAQSGASNGVPFISEVAPPSLPLTTTGGGYVNATLTILGANFPQNATVSLRFSGGNYVIQPTSTTVNANGSQITAQFVNNIPAVPVVIEVTVTNPNGIAPSTSNVFYLPQTPPRTSITLSQKTTIALSDSLRGIAVADLQGGNALPDLAIVSPTSNTLVTELDSYFTGFQSGTTMATGQQPWGVATGSFLQGGGAFPLMAVSNSMDNTVSLLSSDNRLWSTTSVAPGVFPTALAVGDFNRDGHLDIAVVNSCGASTVCFPVGVPQGPGTVTILLGDGLGNFSVSPTQIQVGAIPYGIAAADLNGDGILDLVVANSGDNTLTILMGNGDGTFTPTTSSPLTGSTPMAVAIGDFNGDGLLDIAVTNAGDDTVSILLNQNCPSSAPAACSFAPAPVAPAVGPGPTAIATGDLNGDGILDLVVANASGGYVSVLLGDGTGAFTAAVPQSGSPDFSTGAQPQGVVLADVDLDGRLDIITSNGSGSYSYLRQAAVPQLLLSSNNLSPSYGQLVTYTLQFMPPWGQPTPTGTVTFLDGSTPIGSIPVPAGQVSWEFWGLNAGTHQVTAAYSGDSSFVSATSNSVTETVSKGATSTTLSANATGSPYGMPVTLTGTVQTTTPFSATGTITFRDTTTSTDLGYATLANGQAQLTVSNLATAAHAIVAMYQGDANFAESSSPPVTETIMQATTSITVSANPSPGTLGQVVTFSAAISPSSGANVTGSVFILDGGKPVASGTVTNNMATISTSLLTVGPHAITAQYGGDANFAGSTSQIITETINPGVPVIYPYASQGMTTYGQTVTATAVVQGVPYGPTPTGTVTFLNGSTVLGTATVLSGSAQLTLPVLPVGSNLITSKYSGDSNYQPATSVAFPITVMQATTTTVLSASANPASYNQPVTLTATVKLPYGGTATGPVVFSDGVSMLVTVTPTNNAATLVVSNLGLGSHNIYANYMGDANTYNSSATLAPVLTVNPCPTTTTLTSNVNTSVYGQTVILTFNVQPAFGNFPGGQGGQLSFFDGSTLLGTINMAAVGPQIPFSSLTAGTHTITAQYSGNPNFLASTSAPVTQTVTQATTTGVTVSVYPSPATYGAPVTFSATVQLPYGGASTGTVSFYDGTTAIGSATPANNLAQIQLTNFPVGAHSISARYAGDANTTASASSAVAETVNPATTTTTLTSSLNPSAFGQYVTLSAYLTPVTMPAQNGGVVSFYDGTTLLGTVNVMGTYPSIMIYTLAGGTHNVTAHFSGSADGSYAPSTSNSLTQTVNPGPTTTSLALQNPSSVGQSVFVNVGVFPKYSLGSDGAALTLFDNGTSIGTTTMRSEGGNFTFTPETAGTHSLTVSYAGDSNLLPSTSTPFIETVNAATTTATLSLSSQATNYGQAVTMNLAVHGAYGGNPTGTVTFLDGTTTLGSATLSSGTAQLVSSSLSPGNHSITAKYSGDANFSGSTSAQQTLAVSAATTTTTTSSSANPATYGQTVTLSATVQTGSGSGPTGSLTFYDGSTSLGTAAISGGGAQLAISSLGAGSHNITAVYSGDADFAGSTSTALVETVNAAATSTALSSSSTTASFGQTITLTATVTPSAGNAASGTVTFMDGATVLGNGTLANNSTQFSISTLALGTHSITAAYGGNSNLAGSASSAVTETVNQASTTTSLVTSGSPVAFGQVVTFTATVSPAYPGSATGTVTFYDGASVLVSANVSSNSAQLSVSMLSAGSHSIAAKYSGDPNFSASTSSAVIETVNAAATSTTLASNLNPAVFGQTVIFTAAVQAPSGMNATGTVTFLDGAASLGTVTVSNNAAQLAVALPAGIHSITASYSGNGNLSGSASSALAETVNQAATTTSVSSNLNPSKYTQAVTFTASIQTATGGSASGTVTFYDGGTQFGSASVSGNAAQFTTSALATGSHSITARYSGDANYVGSTSGTLTETINPLVSVWPMVDVQVSADQGSAKSTVKTAAFSTNAVNELLLAFVSADAPSSGTNIQVNSISGAGLTWTLVLRTNAQRGTAEIWRAFAASKLSNVTVTATLSRSETSSLTVMSFTGVDTTGTNGSGAIGAVQSASASAGAPAAQLVTTRNGSLVIGVGNDWDHAIARTVGSGQNLVHQYLSPVGDTYWAQVQSAYTLLSGTTVQINDTAPTGDRFNLAICEILAPH